MAILTYKHPEDLPEDPVEAHNHFIEWAKTENEKLKPTFGRVLSIDHHILPMTVNSTKTTYLVTGSIVTENGSPQR